jgi:integral membrane protein (TIGR01906 family)
MDTATPLSSARIERRPFWAALAYGCLVVIFPVLAVLVSVRLVMTPLFLQVEYNRPGFPADFYGFTTQDRLNYAPFALDYLLNDAGIDYLGDLTFPNGTSLYNSRELGHMVDVKVVTQWAFRIAWIAGILALTASIALVRLSTTRAIFGTALRHGALFTLLLIFTIVVLVIFNWEFFFVAFHQAFFENGTWVFLYSDTLIRLFPEQFWFDAAITIGILSVVFSLLALLGAPALRRVAA